MPLAFLNCRPLSRRERPGEGPRAVRNRRLAQNVAQAFQLPKSMRKSPFLPRKKNIPRPILVRPYHLALLHLGEKPRTETVPMGIATFEYQERLRTYEQGVSHARVFGRATDIPYVELLFSMLAAPL